MTTSEKFKSLETAVQSASMAEASLRSVRAEVDVQAYRFPDTEKAKLIEAADEISKILVRVFKVQELIRTAAVGDK